MKGAASGFLDLVERAGNALPQPTTLFAWGVLLVMVLSAVGAQLGWAVQPIAPRPTTGDDGRTTIELVHEGELIRPVSLLSGDGLYWMVANMVKNFMEFPPLGIVLVGMLGVGVAERAGLLAALLKALMLVTPRALLTPVIFFIGVNANVASDAGYIVLPPLAAGLYVAAGRSPVAGIAACFAGVSAGFSAGLFISAGDTLMAGLTNPAVHLVDSRYDVRATCNWYFLAASAFVVTLIGWAVSQWIVEPRFRRRAFDEGGPPPPGAVGELGAPLTSAEKRGLVWALVAHLVVLALVFLCIFVPGWPLHGQVEARPGVLADKWSQVIVPIIFFAFLTPGIAFGIATGSARSERQIAKLMIDSIASMAAVIVLAFFAAQFIACFNHSNLGKMLAMAGGKALAAADIPVAMLLVLFVLLTMTINLLMSSMSAKYALMAPVFVPMFMMVGISPELTQCAYRVGDSVTNIITPLNGYLVIILAMVQKYMPKAGIGTMLAMMLPYSITFAIIWAALLLAWVSLGIPIGIGGPLTYVPR